MQSHMKAGQRTQVGLAGRALPVGAFLLALLVFAQYGFDGELVPDNAVLLYAGQQMAEGIPPYQSAATLKGPLAQLVLGAAIAVGRTAGWDDVLTARILFWLVSGLTVALVARLGASIWDSPRAGLFAAIIMTGCIGYARHAASGPRYKTLMLLFFVLALLLTVRKRWFAAGAAGALAYLVWQPSALLPAVTLLLAACERARGRALAATAAGVALPVAAIVTWGAAAGISGELAQRLFLFSLPLVAGREPQDLASHLYIPARAILRSYGAWMFAALPAALAVFLSAFRKHRRQLGSWREALRTSPLSVVLVVFVLFIFWSLFDFQGYADFYPLLPPVVLGCGALLARIAGVANGYFGTGAGGRPGAGAWAGAAIVGLLLFWAYTGVHAAGEKSRGGLAHQRQAALEIERRYGGAFRLVSVCDPAPLVLLRRTNPNPFICLYDWLQGLIERRVPGGLEGWLAGLGGGERIVVLGLPPRGMERSVVDSLLRKKYRREKVGPIILSIQEAAP